MDYLKRKTVRIESLNDSIEIRQLSHKAVAEMTESNKANPDKRLFPVIAAKHCVTGWASMSLDDISNALSADQLNDVFTAISEFSGTDEKNSGSTPTDSSSSN